MHVRDISDVRRTYTISQLLCDLICVPMFIDIYIYIVQGTDSSFLPLRIDGTRGKRPYVDIINDFVLSFQTLVKWSMSKFLTSVDLSIPSTTLV